MYRLSVLLRLRALNKGERPGIVGGKLWLEPPCTKAIQSLCKVIEKRCGICGILYVPLEHSWLSFGATQASGQGLNSPANGAASRPALATDHLAPGLNQG